MLALLHGEAVQSKLMGYSTVRALNQAHMHTQGRN